MACAASLHSRLASVVDMGILRVASLKQPFRAMRRGTGRQNAAAGFAARTEGTAAVEFAIIAVPFFAILFATIELALLAFTQQSLDFAVAEGSRQVMTGQAKNNGLDAAKFKQEICARVGGMIDCTADLKVDVKTYASLNTQPKVTITSGAIDTSGFGFDIGNASEIVIVRAVVRYPVFNTLLGGSLPKLLSDGSSVIMSTYSFRNEPYS